MLADKASGGNRVLFDLACRSPYNPARRFRSSLEASPSVLFRISFFVLLLISSLASAACSRSSEANNNPAKPVATVDPFADSDGDGIPDNAELRSPEDRQNFRRWFAAIAEMQFYRTSDEWNASQRDCAGLVRFAWREALRKHDRLWFQKMGAEYEAVAPDVRSFTLESNPLGERLFRTDYGVFKEGDVSNGRFSDFADARTLKAFNCAFVSRDRSRAQRGDLLIFHQPWVQKFPYHMMIFIGEALHDSEGAADWVVYHTGSSPTDEGMLKKVRLSVLDHHPDKRWRPVENNSNFLGFYRLKILE